jgi:peptidoglycan/LPS O-acetylase OafA/YrhL
MRQRLDHLDVLRGVAILGVLLFHSIDAVWTGNSFPWHNGVRTIDLSLNGPSAFWLYPTQLGHLGVAMFFAVSGFCIHYSQIYSNTSWPGLDILQNVFSDRSALSGRAIDSGAAAG